jgi:DNA adenine methylase
MKEKINNKQVFIKWTGSKRKQAPEIVNNFPKEINTYYECFLGGGSVLHELLNRIHNKEISCKKIVCCDINPDLIGIWNMLKNNRQELFDYYVSQYNEIIRRGDIARTQTDDELEITKRMSTLYYENRDKMNNLPVGCEERIKLFYWITRTCFNGLIRYNPKGKFNASYHVAARNGISPDELQKTFDAWSNVMNDIDIEFICDSYDNVISNAKEGDLIYMDPPYENVTGMYFAKPFNNKDLFNIIREINKKNIKLCMSYDGKSGSTDYTSLSVPEDLFIQHIYINSGHSSFKKLKSKTVGTDNKAMLYDSLYMNYK